MELNTRYYENMFDNFARQCPAWAAESVEYRPKHATAIRVVLSNGDQIDYNDQTGSYRYRACDRSVDPSLDDVTDETCRAEFSTNLAEMMNMRGIGQAALASRTGLSSAIISKYLRRQSTPTITNLKRIARALDCHMDELLE